MVLLCRVFTHCAHASERVGMLNLLGSMISNRAFIVMGKPGISVRQSLDRFTFFERTHQEEKLGNHQASQVKTIGHAAIKPARFEETKQMAVSI